NTLLDNVVNEIEEEYGRNIPDYARRAMADHFWCELLAQIAHAVDDGLNVVDSVPERISELIIGSRKDEKRLPLKRFFVESAVKNVWKYIQRLSFAGLLAKGRAVLLVLMILATFMCK